MYCKSDGRIQSARNTSNNSYLPYGSSIVLALYEFMRLQITRLWVWERLESGVPQVP